MYRLASLVLLALTLVAFAGCTDQTSRDNAYVRKVDAAQTQFAASVTRISRAITPTSTDGQDRRTLARFQQAVTKVVGQLRAIAVPSNVRPQHTRLIAAMQQFGADIAQARDELRDPTLSSLDNARQLISQATAAVDARIRAAIGAINAKLGS
jgi:hypothetical protein